MNLSLVALYTLLTSVPLTAIILYATCKSKKCTQRPQPPAIMLKKIEACFVTLVLIYVFILYFLDTNIKSIISFALMVIITTLIPLFGMRNRNISAVIKIIVIVFVFLTFYRLFLTYVPLIYPDSWRDNLKPDYVQTLNPYYPFAYLPLFYTISAIILSTGIFSNMLIMFAYVMTLVYLITQLICNHIFIFNSSNSSSLYSFVIMMSIIWFYSLSLGLASFFMSFVLGMLTFYVALKTDDVSIFSDKRRLVLLIFLNISTLIYHVFCYLLVTFLVFIIKYYRTHFTNMRDLLSYSVVFLLPYFVYVNYTTANYVYLTARFSFDILINIFTGGMTQPIYYVPTGGNPLTTAIVVYLPIVALLVVSFSCYLIYKGYRIEKGIALYLFLMLSVALVSTVTFPVIGLGRYLGVLSIFLGSILLSKFVFKYVNCLDRVCLLTIILISILYSGSFAFTLGTNFRYVYRNDFAVDTLNIRQTRDVAIALTYKEIIVLSDVTPLINRISIYADFFTGYAIEHNILSHSENYKINLISYENIPIDTYELTYVDVNRNSIDEIVIHCILQDLQDPAVIGNITNNELAHSEECIFIRPELSYFRSFYYTTIQNIDKFNKVFDSAFLQVVCDIPKSSNES